MSSSYSVPNERKLTLPLNGLNPHVHVVPCSFEIVTLIRVALERLGLTHAPVEVVLGGGLLQSGDERLISAVAFGLQDVAPKATVKVASSPPVVGAALLGLDEVEAGPDAQTRVREELATAFKAIEAPGRRGT